MIVPSRVAAVVLLALFVASPVYAQGAGQVGGGQVGGGQVGDATGTPADTQFIGAIRDLMIGMHRNLPAGNTDADFGKLMMPYLQSASTLADTELKYGKDADLKATAQGIVDSRAREIAELKAWQGKHPH